MNLNKNQRTAASTFASPHEPMLIPKACKRASVFPAHLTAFQDGFRIAHAQKNKINLCFVDRLVQFDNDKKIKLNK
jgi:hypothetical protein